MKNSDIVKQLKIIVLMFASLALTATSAFALTVTMSAVEGEWRAPDTGQSTPTIPMWGFITDTGSCPASPVTWEEGPTIEVPFGEPSLTINVRNCLSEPVSVFIPGQQKALAPERLSSDPRRVYSFDYTAPAGNEGALTAYTWSNPKSGTYLYHSGTHAQVQVQMGLYGALVVLPAVQATCGQPAELIQEEVLLYSEIDPSLHRAVDTGTYGTPSYPSTFDYQPKYFLINGKTFPYTDNIIMRDEEIRLRFLNAGLKTHIPTVQGNYMKVDAEDGNLYPYKKIQYSIELTAAKTMDAIFPDNGIVSMGRYALYDRSLSLTNAGVTGGGMLTYLVVPGDYPGDTYCSSSSPCSEGLGDCDLDADCESGLICVEDAGLKYGWPSYVDVCERREQGLAYPGDTYCSLSVNGPCGAGLGDCDADGECQSGLICVEDAGPNYGWPSYVDVCEQP